MSSTIFTPNAITSEVLVRDMYKYIECGGGQRVPTVRQGKLFVRQNPEQANYCNSVLFSQNIVIGEAGQEGQRLNPADIVCNGKVLNEKTWWGFDRPERPFEIGVAK